MEVGLKVSLGRASLPTSRGSGRPSINIAGKTTATLADIEGPGAIQHIWLTVSPTLWRRLILRFYWDNEQTPSVEVPVGDFFCNGWTERCNVSSLAICVNPAGGFNSYWEMPFRKHARVTVENLGSEEVRGFYYQFTYALTEATRRTLSAGFVDSVPQHRLWLTVGLRSLFILSCGRFGLSIIRPTEVRIPYALSVAGV